jgi:hypothetical protein
MHHAHSVVQSLLQELLLSHLSRVLKVLAHVLRRRS